MNSFRCAMHQIPTSQQDSPSPFLPSWHFPPFQGMIHSYRAAAVPAQPCMCQERLLCFILEWIGMCTSYILSATNTSDCPRLSVKPTHLTLYATICLKPSNLKTCEVWRKKPNIYIYIKRLKLSLHCTTEVHWKIWELARKTDLATKPQRTLGFGIMNSTVIPC